MIIRFKHFHDSLIIVMILSLVVHFSLLNVPNFGMKWNEGHFSFGTVTIYFLDKLYQLYQFQKSFK